MSLGLLFPPEISAQRVVPTERSGEKWEFLHRCQLNPDAPVDGDSFRVLHNGREYGVRLYGIDAPETGLEYPDRVRDQAAYFGIATNDIPRAGKLAEAFTRERLSGREFTVMTRWQNALGRGSVARFYCEVFIDRRYLSEELVGQGLARIHGVRVDRPDGLPADTLLHRLGNIERLARRDGRGIWNESLFPSTRGRNASLQTGIATSPEASSSPKIDLNTASVAELDSLPGIGPALARRIVANRPFTNVDDLAKVRGIGAKTLTKLKPWVQVSSSGP